MKTHQPTQGAETAADPRRETMIDVNAVVSFNLKAIRERKGWTQQYVADRLGLMTKHVLPQASISAMERGYDGERRRRFDAHELYLFSMVFDVPITYFFMPPPDALNGLLADSERPVSELYVSLLGHEADLEPLDERMAALRSQDPDEVDPVLAAVFGAEGAAKNWHAHYRTWRRQRVQVLAREYGDRLDGVAEVLDEFASEIKAIGPEGYLRAMSYLPGDEDVDDGTGSGEA